MKERKTIIEAYRRATESGAGAALATVVEVTGSAYRRPGARMLVLEDGRSFGSVSGGCLERDVIEHCLKLIKSQNRKGFLLHYDTNHDDDMVFGSSSGCPGSVRIFVEALNPDSADNPVWILEKQYSIGQDARTLEPHFTDSDPNASTNDAFVHSTCISASDRFQLGLAARVIFRRIGGRSGTPAQARETIAAELLQSTNFVPSKSSHQQETFELILNSLEDKLKEDASLVFTQRKPMTQVYKIKEDQSIEFFFELIETPIELFVFGAGHDAPALCELATTLGLQVSVFDHRKSASDPARFPGAVRVAQIKPEDQDSFPQITKNCFCVVMAHNFLVDKQVLSHVLKSKAKYIGALGPKKRTEKILQQLHAEGIGPTEEQLLRLHAPIGLDIGAECPEQIALSILAEIQARASNRQAGFLRDRQDPIHEPAIQTVAEETNTPAEEQHIQCRA